MTVLSEGSSRRRVLTKENLLVGLGILIILVELVNSEVFGRTFHYEFLIAGCALCGVGITQLGDKK